MLPASKYYEGVQVIKVCREEKETRRRGCRHAYRVKSRKKACPKLTFEEKKACVFVKYEDKTCRQEEKSKIMACLNVEIRKMTCRERKQGRKQGRKHQGSTPQNNNNVDVFVYSIMIKYY